MGLDDKVNSDNEIPILPGKEWYEKPCALCGKNIKEDGQMVRDETGRKPYCSPCLSKYYQEKRSEDGSSR